MEAEPKTTGSYKKDHVAHVIFSSILSFKEAPYPILEFVLLALLLSAQQDNQYYTKNWTEIKICKQEFARFFDSLLKMRLFFNRITSYCKNTVVSSRGFVLKITRPETNNIYEYSIKASSQAL